MNIPSGGLTMLVIAAIWFLVFLPSFIKRDQNKLEELAETSRSKEVAKAHLGEAAQKAVAVKRGRTLFATLASLSGIVAVMSSLDFLGTGRSLVLAVSTALVTAFATLLAVKANRNYRALLNNVAVRQVPLVVPVAPVIKRAKLDEESDSTFRPIDVPGQGYLKTGAIEIVQFAEVIDIKSEGETPKIDSIDEIMRRRRQVG